MRAGVAVADSWAILALMRGEGEAGRTMRRLLHRARGGNLRLLLNLINLGEVFYRTIQLVGEVKAEEHLGLIRAAPIELVPVKEPLVLAAARIKARYALSYADAFAVATARMARAPVVTGDPEITLPPARRRTRSEAPALKTGRVRLPTAPHPGGPVKRPSTTPIW